MNLVETNESPKVGDCPAFRSHARDARIDASACDRDAASGGDFRSTTCSVDTAWTGMRPSARSQFFRSPPMTLRHFAGTVCLALFASSSLARGCPREPSSPTPRCPLSSPSIPTWTAEAPTAGGSVRLRRRHAEAVHAAVRGGFLRQLRKPGLDLHRPGSIWRHSPGTTSTGRAWAAPILLHARRGLGASDSVRRWAGRTRTARPDGRSSEYGA